jgi:Fe2+ transport system protein B
MRRFTVPSSGSFDVIVNVALSGPNPVGAYVTGRATELLGGIFTGATSVVENLPEVTVMFVMLSWALPRFWIRMLSVGD